MYQVRVPLAWADVDQVIARCLSWMRVRLDSAETAKGTLCLSKGGERFPVAIELGREIAGDWEEVRVELDLLEEPDHDLYADVYGRMPPRDGDDGDELAPRRGGTLAHELVAVLVHTFDVFRDIDVLTTARIADRCDVPRLLAWVRDPARTMPVVVLGEFRRDRLVHAAAVAEELVCHAHVYALADRRAIQALEDELRAFPCPEGAVRLYRTGFRDDDAPERHPSWNGAAVLAEAFPAKVIGALQVAAR